MACRADIQLAWCVLEWSCTGCDCSARLLARRSDHPTHRFRRELLECRMMCSRMCTIHLHPSALTLQPAAQLVAYDCGDRRPAERPLSLQRSRSQSVGCCVAEATTSMQHMQHLWSRLFLRSCKVVAERSTATRSMCNLRCNSGSCGQLRCRAQQSAAECRCRRSRTRRHRCCLHASMRAKCMRRARIHYEAGCGRCMGGQGGWDGGGWMVGCIV